MIITDCESTTKIINHENRESEIDTNWSEKRKFESLEYPLICKANEFIQNRENNNKRIKIIWIPSHLDKKCTNKEKCLRREKRIKQLHEEFGVNMTKTMIKMNNVCDVLCSKNRVIPDYQKLIDDENAPEGIILSNTLVSSKIMNGKVKNIIQEKHKAEIIEQYANEQEIDMGPLIWTLNSTDTKDRLLITQINLGQIRSSHYINSRMKTKAKLNYYDMTKIILNPSDYCEDNTCNNLLGTRLCTTEHLLGYCEKPDYKASRDKRDQVINDTMRKITKQKDFTNPQFQNLLPNEKTIEFIQAQTLRIRSANTVIEKSLIKQKNLKNKNRYDQEEKDKFDALIAIDVTTKENQTRREQYVDKRSKEKKSINRKLERNYKNGNRILINRAEWMYLETETNLKKKKQLTKEILNAKIEHARRIIGDYYKQKFEQCKNENVNIGKLLLPNRIMSKHGT
jgi:hypothetical protein